ncbi:MAG: hypothetical protein ACFFFH_16425 [Candidatus Thorarchaeota archaeon]
MSKKRSKKEKKGQACVNHPNTFETKECERCKNYFCEECIIEDWSVNFFHQFLGQKRNFVHKTYCKPCYKRVVLIRMIAYAGLLALFGGPVVLWILINIFFRS